MSTGDENFGYVDRIHEWRSGADEPAPGATVVFLGRVLRTRPILFDHLARALHFPAYFGGNWDAFEECLNDLSWLPAGAPVVLVHESLPLPGAPRQRATYLSILRDALLRRREEKQTPELIALFRKVDAEKVSRSLASL